MSFTKTLNFRYKDLGHGGHLVFTFDDEKIDGYHKYRDYYPVVWQVVPLEPRGEHQFSVTYTQQFVFVTSEVQNGIVTTSSALTYIDFKESTTLTGNDDDGYDWSTPVNIPGDKNILEAVNSTAKKQGIAVCIQEGSSIFDSAHLLQFDVKSSGTLKVEFTGKLRIYAVSGFQKGSIIKSEIWSPKLWEHAIDQGGLKENWTVVHHLLFGFQIK